MTQADRDIIGTGTYFQVHFPGGYFFANRAYFGPANMGINFTFCGSTVGYVSIEEVKKVTALGSSVEIVT